jgi:hypothetical protein
MIRLSSGLYVPAVSRRLVPRRLILGGFGALATSMLFGCGGAQKAPLAHLQGKDWVQGAYALYAGEYAEVQKRTENESTGAYAMLAQRGITALDGLQKREVPFFIRADASQGAAFRVEREVPERLTFRAGMTPAQREQAQADWKLARDHIQEDYEQVRRLDLALGVLMAELVNVRNAIDAGQREQYRLVAQSKELEADPTAVPFELPAGVTVKDYGEILLLLIERLDADNTRLATLEAHIVAVGLTARATDAGSATMAPSLRKVLVAVVKDGAGPLREPKFPASDDERAKLLARGKELVAQISTSEAYAAWEKEKTAATLDAFGSFLGAFDGMSPIPISAAFNTAVKLWKGDDDYLGYLKTATGFLPQGAVRSTLSDAVDLTDKARKVGPSVLAAANGDANAAFAAGQGVVINSGSRFARERVGKQLAFFESAEQVGASEQEIASTDLMTRSLVGVGVKAVR